MVGKCGKSFLTLVLFLLSLTSAAIAQQTGSQHQQHQAQTPAGQQSMPMMGPGMGMGMMGPGMDMMGADPAKMQQAQKIMAEYQPKLFQLRQDLYARHAELNAVLAQAQPDVSKAKTIAKQIADLQGQQLTQMVEMRARIAKETGIRMPMRGMGGMGHGMMGGGMMGGGGCPMMRGMGGGMGMMGGMMSMPGSEEDGQ